jgi:hypothetical protein
LEFLNQQQHYFLRKWTDQGENLGKVDDGKFTPIPNSRVGEGHHYDPDNQASTATPAVSSEETCSDRFANAQDGMIYPSENANADEIDSLAPLWVRLKCPISRSALVTPSQAEPSGMFFAVSNRILLTKLGPELVEIFKSFRVAIDDPCYKVLPAALKKYNINAPWEQYTLYITYDSMERCLGMDEKPLRIFIELEKRGKKPMFLLRKVMVTSPEPVSGFPFTQSRTGGITSVESCRQIRYDLPGGVI